MNEFIEFVQTIMAVLSLIGFCFVFLGTIGIILYHHEIWKKGKDEK